MKQLRFIQALLFLSVLHNAVLAMTPTEMIADANLADGLAVCIGPDPELLTALNAHDTFLVHALSRDVKEVATMRAFLRSKGWYGRVSVDRLEGDGLPYADSLVNLLIDSGDGPGLTEEEVLQVLAPKGVAFLLGKKDSTQTNGWTRLIKPWPKAMDEWTHYLHNPAGNPVAEDDLVQPPRQLQWVSDPPWAWTHARTFPGGWIGHLNAGRYNPSGRLLVVDDTTLFGFGRQPRYYRWTTSLEYRLFAVDKEAHQTRDIYAYDAFKAAQLENFPKMKIDRQLGLPSGPRPKRLNSYTCKWKVPNMALLVTAMVATKNALFVAGPEDVNDEGDLFYRDAKDGARDKEAGLARQAALWKDDYSSISDKCTRANDVKIG